MPQLSVGAAEPEYGGDQWHYVLSRILTTARAFGLQAIDGPYAQIRDPEGFRVVARRSQLLGFDGKWALHPDQIELCNEIFSPTPRRRTSEPSASSTPTRRRPASDGLGAVVFEGEMIDEASRKMAEQVAARGRAAGLGR